MCSSQRSHLGVIISAIQNTNFMTEQQKLILEEAIFALREKLTGDMFADMEIRDQIHNLEMQLKGVKPGDSFINCVGCGS
jgi:hypothetical protein